MIDTVKLPLERFEAVADLKISGNTVEVFFKKEYTDKYSENDLMQETQRLLNDIFSQGITHAR